MSFDQDNPFEKPDINSVGDVNTNGKMFINQHMINISFNEEIKQKEERKNGAANAKPSKVQVTPKKATKKSSISNTL